MEEQVIEEIVNTNSQFLVSNLINHFIKEMVIHCVNFNQPIVPTTEIE